MMTDERELEDEDENADEHRLHTCLEHGIFNSVKPDSRNCSVSIPIFFLFLYALAAISTLSNF